MTVLKLLTKTKLGLHIEIIFVMEYYYLIFKVYSIKGQLNLSVNKMNSIVDIRKILFVSKSSLLSPNNRIFLFVE